MMTTDNGNRDSDCDGQERRHMSWGLRVVNLGVKWEFHLHVKKKEKGNFVSK